MAAEAVETSAATHFPPEISINLSFLINSPVGRIFRALAKCVLILAVYIRAQSLKEGGGLLHLIGLLIHQFSFRPSGQNPGSPSMSFE